MWPLHQLFQEMQVPSLKCSEMGVPWHRQGRVVVQRYQVRHLPRRRQRTIPSRAGLYAQSKTVAKHFVQKIFRRPEFAPSFFLLPQTYGHLWQRHVGNSCYTKPTLFTVRILSRPIFGPFQRDKHPSDPPPEIRRQLTCGAFSGAKVPPSSTARASEKGRGEW